MKMWKAVHQQDTLEKLDKKWGAYYEPKEWGRLRYMNCAILRSTKHGYLQEGD